MCGIAGVVTHASTVPDHEHLRAIGEVMRYRGPDDQGTFAAQHVGLVHRRLSIRDLSPAGRCPMSSLDGRLQVVLNGEIYNWRELRSELLGAGYGFHSQSDTEVVVHGYSEWGERLIPRLRGMFALAIWDGAAERLLLARDRVGEKPLYYRVSDAGLEFASTTEALTRMGGGTQIDPAAIACYFAHSFIPATHTVWCGVQVLPPAHVLDFCPGGKPELRRYWDFPASRPVKVSDATALRTTEALIEDSVTRCLDADVPVGVFLSGGVDSSLVAAMAARLRPGLAAFTLGFAEQEFSELPHAREVAKHLGLAHHVLEVSVRDLIDCLPHLVVQYGQPFGDSSAVPLYLVSRLARQHVTVCLSGDGGDESFGGYWRLQAGVYAERYSRLVPEGVRRGVVPGIARQLGPLGQRWQAMNELSLARRGSSYSNFESWFRHLEQLAGPNLQPGLAHDLVACRTPSGTERPTATLTQRLLYDDFQVQLPDDYLTKVDVASMAASLEVRAPLLDQTVVEHAWLLPDDTKLRWGQRKWLLKRIAARWVPPSVIYRPKMGFALPLVHWWRGELGEWLDSLMTDSVAASSGWIRVEPVRRMLHAHQGGEDHQTRLWLVLWLELWFRLVRSPA